MSHSLLKAVQLRVGYQHKALGGAIDLALHEGEVLALLGPNGSGKTTLFRTLLGLLKPVSGTVYLLDKALNTYSRRQIAQLAAYVPQAQIGSFDFTVEEMVIMGRYAAIGRFSQPSNKDRHIALACLRQLGIEQLANASYMRISGGQRQLVLIARALTQNAKILVLDEPTASLDFANQILVLDSICQLRAQGMAILLCTHQPEHALQVADRVALYNHGEIQTQGKAQDMLTVENLAQLYGLTSMQIKAHFKVQTKVDG
ncbi:ABC transporter ATP-binding protein [Pseudomonas sp. F1_0610]|uniref:ABC transporter ATP-binding protein n=1 Tax=Pseudomonas sp. F1_0610 TaxID=3114284 RepID=UPI0039C47AF6